MRHYVGKDDAKTPELRACYEALKGIDSVGAVRRMGRPTGSRLSHAYAMRMAVAYFPPTICFTPLVHPLSRTALTPCYKGLLTADYILRPIYCRRRRGGVEACR